MGRREETKVILKVLFGEWPGSYTVTSIEGSRRKSSGKGAVNDS